jgi:hypothetical protein
MEGTSPDAPAYGSALLYSTIEVLIKLLVQNGKPFVATGGGIF